MSLDNDFEFRGKVEATQELLMAAVDEKNADVRRLVEKLSRIDTSAFSGGYDERLYNETKDGVAELREALDDGVVACNKEQMRTALNRTEQLLDHYKANNSFAAKADDESVDVDGGLSF